MYHYDPCVALDELQDENHLPNPVHVRDMILRTQHSPGEALDLNREFLAYQQAFSSAQKLAGDLLGKLASAPRKA